MGHHEVCDLRDAPPNAQYATAASVATNERHIQMYVADGNYIRDPHYLAGQMLESAAP
jgi:hypothetical protein